MVLDLLTYLFAEGLFELGNRSLFHFISKRPAHPVILTGGYILWGIIAGGISLWLMPKAFITHTVIKFLNLIISPIIIGIIMMYVGKSLEKKGKKLTSLDHFGYAFIFAFSMALMRFIFAT